MTAPATAPATPPGPIQPRRGVPLAELVADRVVDAIVRGRLDDEARLMEADVARHLGLSRSPLREAFRVLHSQGLLVITPRRGTRVIRFHAGWRHDVREVRWGIERVAADRASGHLRRDPRDLDAALAGIEAAVRAGDVFAINEADLAFHGAIVAAAGSELLDAMWAAIRRHVLILFAHDVKDYDARRIVADHERLRDALVSPPGPSLEQAMSDHVRWRPD